MLKKRTSHILALVLVIQAISGCSGSDANSNNSGANAANQQANSNRAVEPGMEGAKDNADELATLIKMPFVPEDLVWKEFTAEASRLARRKFRRQHSVGNYILDFYCESEKLAIELDGEVHFGDRAIEYDTRRKLWLKERGIKIVRFENYLVFQELESVLHRIESYFGWSQQADAEAKNSAP